MQKAYGTDKYNQNNYKKERETWKKAYFCPRYVTYEVDKGSKPQNGGGQL